MIGFVASHSIWTVSADQPPLSSAVITSVSAKNGKLQVKGQNFATGDKIEVDGTVLDDTKAKKNKPSTVLTAVSGGNLAAGTYVMTVRSVSGSRSAPFLFDNKVSNGSPQVTIKVEPPALQVVKNEQIQLTAKALDATGSELAGVAYVWSVSNPAIASVDETGKVTGLATGQVTVSAVALRTTGLSTIDVTEIQTGTAGVQILTSDLVVNEGQTLSLTAIVRDEAGQPIPGAVVTWESDSPEIATVDTTGRIQ
ncbi:MAG TPA: Ig-like domain-containing protein, partial [Acidobacteriota bacterium]|nr:Ig-like domain-containing protein [Acidobacteriota bacterium]